MDWHVRLVWCLPLAALLAFALTPVEADRGSESREKRNVGCDKSQNSATDKCLTSKLKSHRYGDKPKPTPEPKIRNIWKHRSTKAPVKSTTEMSHWQHEATTARTHSGWGWGGHKHGQKPSAPKHRLPRAARLHSPDGGWVRPHSAHHNNVNQTTQRSIVHTMSPVAEENNTVSPINNILAEFSYRFLHPKLA